MTSTYQSLLLDAAHMHAERLAFSCGSRRLTHAQWCEQVSMVAAGLSARGVSRGGRVALLSTNRIESTLVLAAAGWIGAIAVPLNTRLAPAEIQYVLADSAPTLLIAEPTHLHEGCPAPQLVKLDESADECGASFRSLLSHGTMEPVNVGDDAPLLLVYTAATQGRPRGAVITHGNLAASARQLAAGWSLGPEHAALGVLPLFHIAGLALYAAIQVSGGSTALQAKYDAQAAARLIDQGRVNVIGTFAPMLGQLLDAAAAQGLNLAALRVAFGIEPPEVTRRLAAMAPGATFYGSYGQTETGIVASAPLKDQPGSVGRALTPAELRVVDESGREQPPGAVGHLQVRGPSVSCGYWMAGKGAPARQPDLWHDTGDLGALDGRGYLWFHGPAPQKRLIKSGGENIYPAEVEQALRSHPDVVDVAVVGIPDPEWGEAVAAMCVRRPCAVATAQALCDFVANTLARYKRPRKLAFVDVLPRDGTGQPDIPRIQAAMQADLGSN